MTVSIQALIPMGAIQRCFLLTFDDVVMPGACIYRDADMHTDRFTLTVECKEKEYLAIPHCFFFSTAGQRTTLCYCYSQAQEDKQSPLPTP